MSGDNSLLACFFVLLFLLDLFHSEIFADPLDLSGLSLDGGGILELKLDGKLFILDNFVLIETEDDGKVI